jgi:hypothetical protein
LTVRLPAVVFVTKIYFKVGIETVNSVLSRARLWFGPSEIGFHGGKVTVRRPRVRSYEGHELALPTWTAAQAEDWLGRWAMNLMLINVSTRKLRRAVRLPEGDLPALVGDGTSKSAASRRFVALSADRLAEWMASDLSELDLLVIQIDGLHIGNDLVHPALSDS